MWVMILKRYVNENNQSVEVDTFNALYVGDDFETVESELMQPGDKFAFNALYVGDDFETGNFGSGNPLAQHYFQCPLCG